MTIKPVNTQSLEGPLSKRASFPDYILENANICRGVGYEGFQSLDFANSIAGLSHSSLMGKTYGFGLLEEPKRNAIVKNYIREAKS